MTIIHQKFILREDLRANPDVLYLFGDNEERIGYGGQAGQMRDEPNAVGIRTCSFNRPWSDEEFLLQSKMIDDDLAPVQKALSDGAVTVVVIPADGLGTGISALWELAPKTFAYLSSRLKELELKP